MAERIRQAGRRDTGDEIRMRRTLEDTLASSQARLDNLLKAKSKHELVQLELDRIDAKITSIAELAVNRQEPDFITSEVDGVAATMEQTEKAMSELQFLSGLDEQDVVPPSFIDEDLDICEGQARMGRHSSDDDSVHLACNVAVMQRTVSSSATTFSTKVTSQAL